MISSSRVTSRISIYVEVRLGSDNAGQSHERPAELVSNRSAVLPAHRSGADTRVVLDIHLGSTERPGAAAVTGPGERSAAVTAAGILPEVGTPEFAAIYRQMWVTAGQKCEPNILAWGVSDDSP